MQIKIAVVGSNSFSGSHFIDLLIEEGKYDIIGLSRSREKTPIFLPYKKHKKPPFKFFRTDLNKDVKETVEILSLFKPDYIVNFAGLIEVASSWKYPQQYIRTNTLAQVSLMTLLSDSVNLKSYIHISTPEVYGSCVNAREDALYNPSSPYAVSKAAADMYLNILENSRKFPARIIRSTNVYGPGQQLFRIIPKTVISLKKGKVIPLDGGGKAVKSYIHIKDVCRGIMAVINKGRDGNIYHFSPDEGGKPVKEIVKIICDLAGGDFKKAVKIAPERLGQDASYIIDSTKARIKLKWKPQISFEEGIQEVIGWVNDNWNEIKKFPLIYEHKF